VHGRTEKVQENVFARLKLKSINTSNLSGKDTRDIPLIYSPFHMYICKLNVKKDVLKSVKLMSVLA
jgi:hypothetical protein